MIEGAALTAERLGRWRAVQPRRGRPWTLAPFLVWVVLIVLATVFADEGGCTVAAPCGPTWADAAETSLGMAAPVLLLWVPGPALWFSLLAGTVFVAREWGPQDQPRWFVAGFAVALALATVVAWQERRRRQATVAELLRDVPTATWPGEVPVLPRVPVLLRMALVLVLAGTATLAWGVHVGQSRAESERLAPRVVGTVVAHDDVGYLLTVRVDDLDYEVDSLLAADYPVGSEQELVLDGDRVVLAVERYDPAYFLFFALALALAGLALAQRSLEARQRLSEVLTAPQPVHRARLGLLGEAQVLPVDGPVDVLPLVALPLALEPDVPGDPLDGVAPVLTADLLGLPLRGSVVAVVLQDRTRLLPGGRVRRAEPAWAFTVALQDEADGPDLVLTPVDVPSDVAALRASLLRRRWWRAPLGVTLVVGAVAGGFLIGVHSDGPWAALWRCALAASFAFDGLVKATSGVGLTSTALVHTGPTTRRTIPWGSVRQVSVVDDLVVLALDDDGVLPLTWLPGRPYGTWRGRRAQWAAQWASVLTDALRHAPASSASRVTVEPRIHAAAVAVAFVASVVVGLQVRS